MTQSSVVLICGLLTVSSVALAQNNGGGVSLEQTRVIFSAGDKGQTVAAKNTDSRSYLLQAQVQNSLEDITPAPFIVTPPLSLLKGNSRQLLRILPPDAKLPNDRESLFYLSVAVVPSQSEPMVGSDRLSVGVRFLVKLFYRPEGLSPSADSVPCQLIFNRVAQGVRVSNPTPYFQTLGELTFNGRNAVLEPTQSMVAPQDSHIITVKGLGDQLSWKTITDYGVLSQSCQQTLSVPQETTR
ncbi:fimbrial biogenesis chaperone [Serratia oryzae]|uniref:Pilus assembly protein PapD n=1 Tax=Serratia oryzae TaxID=2034155 RepID=A0A1S8CK44_9GAMM|nr:molecular chaperone [Serratia oryzae]OMQ23690.1 hypothetical protein BMI79_09260 [Serratia oryzae]